MSNITEKKKNDEFKEVAEEPKAQQAVPSAQPLESQAGARSVKRIYRSKKDRILGGVCGGFAEYFAIDPVLMRILWVIFLLAGGSGVLAYIICWIIIPEKPE